MNRIGSALAAALFSGQQAAAEITCISSDNYEKYSKSAYVMTPEAAKRYMAIHKIFNGDFSFNEGNILPVVFYDNKDSDTLYIVLNNGKLSCLYTYTGSKRLSVIEAINKSSKTA